jgi:hypothetical protein
MRFFAKKSDFDQKTDDSQTFRSLQVLSSKTKRRVEAWRHAWRQVSDFLK